MKVVWSETALDTYLKVIDYLFDHWSDKEIEAFEFNVDSLIQRINAFKQICPESKLLGFRKCVIDEHNSVIYKISDNTLYLLTFINNRSRHSY